MGVVRFRVRHPSGILTLQLDESSTAAALVERIREETGIQNFSLKKDYPPVVLELHGKDTPLLALEINRSTLTLMPKDVAAEDQAAARAEQDARDSFLAAEIAAASGSTSAEGQTDTVENLSVDWPERDGRMVLRVMADDNSCLFTALSSALVPEVKDPAPFLRKQIAEYILSHPDTYNMATLEKPPRQYVEKLQGKDFWGGSIEISVLSDIYDIEIVAVDVKTLECFRHGENKQEMCLVLYSGIHYDRIVWALGPDTPPEFDASRFETTLDSVISRAKELAKKLQRANYYTDTNTMVLRCVVPGCEWIGDAKAANEHIKETGHQAFDEIPDIN